MCQSCKLSINSWNSLWSSLLLGLCFAGIAVFSVLPPRFMLLPTQGNSTGSHCSRNTKMRRIISTGLAGGGRKLCSSTNWHFQALLIHRLPPYSKVTQIKTKEAQVFTLFPAQSFKINYLLGFDHSLSLPHPLNTSSSLIWPQAPLLLTPLILSITNNLHVTKSTGHWCIFILSDLSGSLGRGKHQPVCFPSYLFGYSLSVFAGPSFST